MSERRDCPPLLRGHVRVKDGERSNIQLVDQPTPSEQWRLARQVGNGLRNNCAWSDPRRVCPQEPELGALDEPPVKLLRIRINQELRSIEPAPAIRGPFSIRSEIRNGCRPDLPEFPGTRRRLGVPLPGVPQARRRTGRGRPGCGLGETEREASRAVADGGAEHGFPAPTSGVSPARCAAHAGDRCARRDQIAEHRPRRLAESPPGGS